MKLTYKATMLSCFTGYVILAITNNFFPLLLVTFQGVYRLSLAQLSFLITLTFGTQLVADVLASKYADRFGYRTLILFAHAAITAGFLSLTILPDVLEPFWGFAIAIILYALGAGITDVLLSPIMESCPTENKETAMSLLHSFYCWGHVAVITLSTLFFYFWGTQNWKILACLWAALPVFNGILFSRVPIFPLVSPEQNQLGLKSLLSNKTFWLLILMMVCAGACEISIGQWASAFAEQSLGISKTAGDLAGPMIFAILMGTSRAFYGKHGNKIPLDRFMRISTILCIASYLLASLSGSAVLSLIGCALSGLGIGIMWPGIISKAASSLCLGGTIMFALLSIAGDFGCTIGPGLVGLVSGTADGNLKMGILAATIFPLLLLLTLIPIKKNTIE